MGDFEINTISWNLNIEQIHNLAYHIGYNEPKFPKSPEHNLLFKEDLAKLLDKLNVILKLDSMKEPIEIQWKMGRFVKGENMCVPIDELKLYSRVMGKYQLDIGAYFVINRHKDLIRTLVGRFPKTIEGRK